MLKLEVLAYDVENRQKRFEMRRHDWNTMSLPYVRDVRTSASLKDSRQIDQAKGHWNDFIVPTVQYVVTVQAMRGKEERTEVKGLWKLFANRVTGKKCGSRQNRFIGM